MTATTGGQQVNRSLSKSDVTKAFYRWWLMSHLAYNYQRMQAGAFASMMGPLLKKLYPDKPEEVAEGLKRHMLFFNTEPRWGAIIPGLAVALEEQRAKDPGSVAAETIVDLKGSLMGPMAGLGDTLTQALFKPLLLSICLGWAATGGVLGPLVFGIVGFSFDYFVTRYSFHAGYRLGTRAIQQLMDSTTVKQLTTALSVMGLMVLGALITKFVSVNLVYEVVVGQTTVNLGNTLNSIVPKIIPLLITWLAYRAMARGWSVAKVLLTLFLIALIGGFLGILG